VLPLLVALALEVHATGDCPVAADVQRQLEPLLAAGAAARDVATINPGADGSVSLALIDANGQSIGARTLPRARSCDDQAKAVAVTLAVLEAELHPQVSLGLDRLAPEPGPVAVAVAKPAPPPPRVRELAVGAGAFVDRQVGAWAPGGRLELALGTLGARWRVRVGAAAVGRHEVDVASGQASWWRGFVQVGADLDLARGRRWAFTAGAGALGGVVSIAGTGFAVDHSARSLDLGAEGRARFILRAGRTRLWLGAAIEGWVRQQTLDLNGASTGAALPRIAPVAAAGAEFVW
jgi:hypothetical protein